MTEDIQYTMHLILHQTWGMLSLYILFQLLFSNWNHVTIATISIKLYSHYRISHTVIRFTYCFKKVLVSAGARGCFWCTFLFNQNMVLLQYKQDSWNESFMLCRTNISVVIVFITLWSPRSIFICVDERTEQTLSDTPSS